MTDRLLHIPEGVRDIYGDECEKEEFVKEGMKDILKLYGFRPISTPSFEFFDVFNKDRGTVHAKEMYKFFDREGNTMALRPDITPSIARCVAKYYRDETFPIRLSYVGNTFINNSSYQGKLKEITQVGAELINDSTADADAQMIALCCECILKSGLKEFRIDLGHADLFNGLMEETGFDADEVMELKILIEEKNIFGASSMLSTKDVDVAIKDVILKLPELFGNYDIIDKARSIISNEKALAALDRLDKIYSIIDSYGLSRYVSFDLGMLSKYNYYTGIIMKAYTYGTGDAIASGGRYDKFISQFGKDAPAIGIVILLDQVMMALWRQKIEIEIDNVSHLIVYNGKSRNTAIELANQFRKDNKRVELFRESNGLELDDYIKYALANKVGVLYYITDSDNVTVIDINTGKRQTASVNDFAGKES